jgi:hypothetical protein
MKEAGLANFDALTPPNASLIDVVDRSALDTALARAAYLHESGDDTMRVRAKLVRFLLLGDPAPQR